MQKHKAWVVQQLDTGLLKDIASLYLHQAPAMVYLNSKKFQLNTILNMHEWHFYNKNSTEKTKFELLSRQYFYVAQLKA